MTIYTKWKLTNNVVVPWNSYMVQQQQKNDTAW